MKKDLFRKGIVFAVIVLFVGTVVVPSVMPRSSVNTQKKHAVMSVQNTWIVDDEGDGDFTCIQGAIDNASDGDTIEVYSGTYNENVVVNKKLTIKGIDHEYPPNGDDTGKPVIDGGESGDVVKITADEVKVSGFTIQNSGNCHGDAGIDIRSNYTTISVNNISNNLVDGIRLYYSCNNTISNNIISNNFQMGLRLLEGSSHNTISGNIISDSQHGIDLSWSSNYNIISGNTISSNHWHNQAGISIGSCRHNTISNNNISNNRGSGIIGWGTSDSNISGNNISMNNRGGLLFTGKNNIISGNNISMNNGDGICSKTGKNNIISGNNISMNNGDGIHFGEVSELIYIVSYSTILGNTISKNNGDGINFIGSDNNTISENNISSNVYGIHLQEAVINWTEHPVYDVVVPSSDNIIYHNNLINNTQNAYDECDNNWYNNGLKQGNYWDDYNGIDILPPWGIGDSPYNIPGGNNKDRFPLMKVWPDVLYNSNQPSQSQPSSQQPSSPLFFQILGRLLGYQ